MDKTNSEADAIIFRANDFLDPANSSTSSLEPESISVTMNKKIAEQIRSTGSIKAEVVRPVTPPSPSGKTNREILEELRKKVTEKPPVTQTISSSQTQKQHSLVGVVVESVNAAAARIDAENARHMEELRKVRPELHEEIEKKQHPPSKPTPSSGTAYRLREDEPGRVKRLLRWLFGGNF